MSIIVDMIVFIADLFFFLFFLFLFVATGSALMQDYDFWYQRNNAFFAMIVVFAICIIVMLVYGYDIYGFLRMKW